MFEDTMYNSGKRILIVDDDTMLLSLFENILKRAGYATEAFSSSTEAVEYITNNSNNIDLIFSDFQMPDLTGLELAVKVNRDKFNIPVIICSGSSPEEIPQDQFNQGGVVHLLHKPVSNNDLLATVEIYI